MNLQDAFAAPLDALSRRFDLLAAGATDYALFLTNPAGFLICWNLGAERFFGYRADERGQVMVSL